MWEVHVTNMEVYITIMHVQAVHTGLRYFKNKQVHPVSYTVCLHLDAIQSPHNALNGKQVSSRTTSCHCQRFITPLPLYTYHLHGEKAMRQHVSFEPDRSDQTKKCVTDVKDLVIFSVAFACISLSSYNYAFQ